MNSGASGDSRERERERTHRMCRRHTAKGHLKSEWTSDFEEGGLNENNKTSHLPTNYNLAKLGQLRINYFSGVN